jgi:hypothetical protein
MKQLCLTILFIQSVNALKAQTFEEWTHQKKTKVKYGLEQMAKLRVYAASVRKGYSIVNNGLSIISDIKSGDFNLHQEHFSTWQKVNPMIKVLPKVAAILKLQESMLKAQKMTNNYLNESGGLHKDELDYYIQVTLHLLESCADNIDLLVQLVADDQYTLTDDERITRINALYEEMVDKAAFLQSFYGELKTLALQQLKKEKEVQINQLLHGVK